MRKTLLALLLLLPLASPAKIKLGIRGGANITHFSFSGDVMDARNRTGFFLGPTMKIGLPAGLDIDISALYNQWEADPEIYYSGSCQITETKGPVFRRKEIAVPLNLRKGFGLGDKASLFLFAGPQVAWRLGKSEISEYTFRWKDSSLSLNMGFGAMLLGNLEIKANYNLALNRSGEFYDLSRDISAKSGGWQIGLAVYF